MDFPFVTTARRSGIARVLSTFVLALVAASLPAMAQQPQQGQIAIEGQLTDAEKEPIPACRVVFRVVGQAEVFLSEPTDEQGRYSVMVPVGRSYVAVAVLSPEGKRVRLDDMPAIEARPGVDQDVRLPIVVATPQYRDPRPFAGADRLFLAFAEDVVEVDHWRVEGALELADLGAGDARISSITGVANFESLPRLEFGARIGYAGVDFDGGGEASGATDMDVWGKLDLGARGRNARVAAGVLATLATGDEDTGLSADALRSKLFVAVRFDVPRATISAHGGLRFNEDAEVAGLSLDGQVAPALGIAALVPFGERLVLVGELGYEGERFDGGDPDTRALVGANWKPKRVGHVRLALSTGLSDGAPDLQLIAGYALEF